MEMSKLDPSQITTSSVLTARLCGRMRLWRWTSSRGRLSQKSGSASTGGEHFFLCLLNFFAQSFTFKLTVTLSRNAKDVDFAYSITTRVPECLGSSLRCHRLEQVYSLGPLQLNKEVVLRTSSTLRNNRTLFTDDNGYQMIKRPYRKFINNTLARVRT